MGMFDALKQTELQAECRVRGLPAGGSNEEIVARLEEFERNQLLSEAPTAPPEPTAPAESPALPAVDGDIHIADPPPVASQPEQPIPDVPKAKEYRVAFPCPAELSTGMHEEYLVRAWNQAVGAGVPVRGGSGTVARVGWQNINGTRHAVYSVPLRKQ